MVVVGYHASHEQHPPSELLRLVRRAEDVGFDAAWSSDHLVPWSESQGASGFAWSWLGAAMQATSFSFGVVTAPGQRYHPVVLGHAVATLGELFPGRLTVALGSGEASNEHVTGERWPPKSVRHERLLECVHVLRALLRGEEVSIDGHVRVDRARLWTLPAEPVALIGAALTEPTARWCGGWADGLITAHQPGGDLRAVVDAFREGGGAGKPVLAQAKVAWASTDDDAVAAAYDQWRTNVLDPTLLADIERVEQFEAAARFVRPGDVAASVLCSADLGRHAAFLREAVDAGADAVYVHQVPKDQDRFLDAYAAEVLPEVR